MLLNLKNILHWITYFIGICFYIPIAFSSNLSLAIIWLLFIIYCWLISSLIFKTYNLKNFIYVICFSGIVVSISMFIINGIEQLALPVGAVLFHVDEISNALLVLFIFTAPIIIYTYNNTNPSSGSSISNCMNDKNENKKVSSEEKNYDSEKWEEATIEDLESNSFEII